MRPPAAPVVLRFIPRFVCGAAALIRPAWAAVAFFAATLVAPAATVSLPLTTGETSKLSVGTFAGGTLVQLTVTGSGDLVDSRLQAKPDGSLVAAATSPYTFFNAGQPYAA
eukprot:gene54870-75177_t